jgi:hypothetical protein
MTKDEFIKNLEKAIDKKQKRELVNELAENNITKISALYYSIKKIQ